MLPNEIKYIYHKKGGKNIIREAFDNLEMNDNYLPLIVTHKHCIRVLFKHMLNLNDREFDNFTIQDNSIYIVSLDNELNYFKHEILEY